jgi:hypothetical protein
MNNHHDRIRRIFGTIALCVGIISAAFWGYGIYFFFMITDMLNFLAPSYVGLAKIVLCFVVSVAVAYGGLRIARRHGHPR